jgi:hypothetical protein
MNNQTMQTENYPWDQLKGENSRQFLAFSQFLELGGQRSYSKIAAALKISPRTLYRWATKWNWDPRASAYDKHIIEIRKKKKQKKYEKLKNLHSDSMIDISFVIYKILNMLNKRTNLELNNLSSMDYTKLLKALRLFTNVLPSLSNFASDNLRISKPAWHQENNPLDLLTIYDKHPELLDDVYGLIDKINAVEDIDDKME